MDAEVRTDVPISGGWMLRQRTRTTGDHAPEIRYPIKDPHNRAQRDERAEPVTTQYLVFTQDKSAG